MNTDFQERYLQLEIDLNEAIIDKVKNRFTSELPLVFSDGLLEILESTFDKIEQKYLVIKLGERVVNVEGYNVEEKCVILGLKKIKNNVVVQMIYFPDLMNFERDDENLICNIPIKNISMKNKIIIWDKIKYID